MGELPGSRLFDETGEVTPGGEAGDTDELDLISELGFDRCDRRAFCFARSSPRSPEPDDQILVGQSG